MAAGSGRIGNNPTNVQSFTPELDRFWRDGSLSVLPLLEARIKMGRRDMQNRPADNNPPAYRNSKAISE
jgi:hypothetical protein